MTRCVLSNLPTCFFTFVFLFFVGGFFFLYPLFPKASKKIYECADPRKGTLQHSDGACNPTKTFADSPGAINYRNLSPPTLVGLATKLRVLLYDSNREKVSGYQRRKGRRTRDLEVELFRDFLSHPFFLPLILVVDKFVPGNPKDPRRFTEVKDLGANREFFKFYSLTFVNRGESLLNVA